MFLNHKFKVFIYSAILLTTQSIYAKTSELDRVNIISKSMIGLFSQDPNQDQLNLKMSAAIAGISEAEAKKNRDESGEKQATASEKMKEILKEQFNANDFKIVAPAFERQMKAQSAAYQSCKQDGKIIENSQSFQVPLTCKVPMLNLDNVQMPERGSKESDAQFAAKATDFLTELLIKAPTETLKTSILIHKMGEQLIPEMDDPQYFPDTISRKTTGTSEAELDEMNQQ